MATPSAVLREAWEAFAAAGIPDAQQAPAWEALCRRYGEAHRHYHGFAHLEDLLAQAAHRPWQSAWRVQATIWYHDLIYDPWRRDNEARSAAEAAAQLKAWGHTAKTCDWVSSAILATAGHQPRLGDADEATFLDLDLSVLARPAEAYDAYAAAIRREYRHVPGPLYRRGRRQVLQSFLDRPHLYFTPEAQATWEAPARANLARELAHL